MSIGAFSLTGYRIDEPGPLQGALAFGVLNMLAGSLLALGLALVYGRTGALNLADAGAALAGRPPDTLVVVAFGLLCAGFLVKAGVPPFHFWLADAYAAAPAPVCVLLSGVMSDLGIHALGRVYAHGFSGAFAGHEDAVRAILVAIGVAGALLAAVMAFVQAELKRMLAYLTASHASIFLAATALFAPNGLGGATIWVVTDGLAKGALFLCVGVVVHELRDGDELRLRGRGKRLPVTAGVFGAAALSVALLPPFGTFLGFAVVDRSAGALGYGWLPALLALASLISGAAVLRAGARVFLGLGDAEDPLLSRQPEAGEQGEPEEAEEAEEAEDARGPWPGLGPAIVLAAAALGLGLTPGLADGAARAAAHALDRHALVAAVFRGIPEPTVHLAAMHVTASAYGYGAGATLGALALAAIGLWRQRLPAALQGIAGRVLGPPVSVLRAAHSGVLGEYVTWMTAGTTALLALFVAFAR
jgi:multicomponent Na+:H+ antiporter subunit D